MIIVATVGLLLGFFIAVMASVISVGNRTIAAEIDRDLQEALECIAIARRVHQRRRTHIH